MNSETQLKVQAYLDNELSPGEARQIASLLNSDPDARGLYQELKETKAIVGPNELVPGLPESRDFYWSKVQRGIAQAPRPERPAASAWWLRLLAPAAGALALFTVLIGISGNRPADRPVVNLASKVEPARGSRPIHEGEVVLPNMSAITFRSEAEGVTVVWVSSDVPQAAEPSLLEWFE